VQCRLLARRRADQMNLYSVRKNIPAKCRVRNVRPFVPFAAMVSWAANCGVVSASRPVLTVLVLLWHGIVGVAVLVDVYQLQDGDPPDST
jgi:hypothetical protein